MNAHETTAGAQIEKLDARKTGEHVRMEKFYATRGVIGCWTLDNSGEYVSKFARDAWHAWQAAQYAALETAALQREFTAPAAYEPGTLPAMLREQAL